MRIESHVYDGADEPISQAMPSVDMRGPTALVGFYCGTGDGFAAMSRDMGTSSRMMLDHMASAHPGMLWLDAKGVKRRGRQEA